MADETVSEEPEGSEEGEAAPADEPTVVLPAASPDAPTVPTEAVVGSPPEPRPWYEVPLPPVAAPAAPLEAPPFMAPPPPPGGPGPGGPAAPGGPPGSWFAPPDPGAPRSGGAASSSRRVGVLVALAVLAAGGLGAGLGASLSNNTPASSVAPATLPTQTTVPVGANPVARIVKDVEPAVVDINTRIAEPEGMSAEQAAGTGMIISASGDVLTNNHVVVQGTTITAVVSGHAGSYPVKVLGVDPNLDIALLKIEGLSHLPTVSLGDSTKVRVGDTVVAIGNALGLGGPPSSASGTITATDRTITAQDATASSEETLSGLLETDATIEEGDSGGPLVDSSEQVVGMITAAEATDNGPSIGFAIPINTARTIAGDIERRDATDGIILGESPFLGVAEEPSGIGGGFGGFNFSPSGNTGSTGNTGAVSGVEIGAVVAGGPAAGAGLAAGDTITALNGAKTASWAALEAQVARYRPGTRVAVSYLAATGTAHTLTVTLGGIPE